MLASFSCGPDPIPGRWRRRDIEMLDVRSDRTGSTVAPTCRARRPAPRWSAGGDTGPHEHDAAMIVDAAMT